MECMTTMRLGSAIWSRSRIFNKQVAVFAQWENEASINKFLIENKFGHVLSKGWHTRLTFLRQWGKINQFKIPHNPIELEPSNAPVVAITIARMKLFEIPRFIHWGRPVEKLVRDHPGTTFSLASIRLPRTISTFSVWKSEKEMTDMVLGRSNVHAPKRHIHAMKERDRKDFHMEFTTLRFKPLSEYGEWNGRTHLIPNL